jgi:hypothetical protein
MVCPATIGALIPDERAPYESFEATAEKKKEGAPVRTRAACGVQPFRTANINDLRSVTKIRSWNPDLNISTNLSHYAGMTVRESVAEQGGWNLHKSLLPQPSFSSKARIRAKVKILRKKGLRFYTLSNDCELSFYRPSNDLESGE